MPSVPTIDDLKMLVAVLSQFAPDNKPFPSPNHLKLAQDLGLRDRNVSKGQWFRLVKKMKTGEFGDFGDLIVEKESVESPGKKRAVVEVPLNEDMSEARPSPSKKVKGGERSGKGKSKKEVAIERYWDDDEC
ncbi:hypothetical protein MFRU_003g04220 [Monilinia fructicola]|uniref:Uncharacterized protein n=1 Tax=Monilinia fructicola TaxID=38448 RepID=A0A5M9JW65_MONFR|nr:hypothetical protein EYC84_002972 [Monilinia fructicola]KAG4034459.1 hypothetical protein MFRU_003g04220 [Monilinia fructicola]